MDQYYGLNNWACNFLSETVEVEEKGERIYPDKSSEFFSQKIYVPVHRTTIISALNGSSDLSGHCLNRYEYPNDVVYEEYVQDVLSYSRQCYFIALKKDGKVVSESLWRKKEMMKLANWRF